MAITDSWLRSNNKKPVDSRYIKTDMDGLGVRVSTRGRLTFQIRYWYYGVQKRLDLGTYPLMSLSSAREENRRLRSLLEKGFDPKQVKLQEEINIKNEPTLKEMFDDWYEKVCVKDVKKPEQIKRTFELHVFPKLGNIKAGKIDTNQWALLIDDVSAKYPHIALRILSQLKKMYRRAYKLKVSGITQNPVADLSGKNDFNIKKNKGKRVMSDAEIIQIWEALNGMRLSPQRKLFVKFILFFGCRANELYGSRKSDYDLSAGIWTTHEHKIANNDRIEYDKPIVRPIIDEIKPYIERVKLFSESDEWMFTHVNRPDRMPDSAHIDFPYQIRQWIESNKGKKAVMPHWSCHDLRRTMRTRMSEYTTREVAEIMIGHKLDNNHETYNHYDYLIEQSEAYHKWWCHLISLVGEF